MISVIDDDAPIRAAIENLLNSLDYRVFTFGSAEAFLRSDGRADTDCVIADINMPVMTGIELLAHLRERGNDVPLICITGFPNAATVRQAMNAGAASVLTKPINGDNLVNEIKRALRRSGATSADD